MHPYLDGNFAPIQRELPLTPCPFSGTIPAELVGGQYVRNGGNPFTNGSPARDAHWFDGDGMLSGVLFRRLPAGGARPEFTNQYVRTDVLLAAQATPALRTPILPSITTLVDPCAPLLRVVRRILRALVLVVLSHLPGAAPTPIRRVSVANTGVLYHDGRALATCESGPPMRVALPGLQTVGWFDGVHADGEGKCEEDVRDDGGVQDRIGGRGMLKFFREWTTGHPRVDPVTRELVLFHSTFVAPYVRYSVIPSTAPLGKRRRLVNVPVPGVMSPKMMHDFGVSRRHTVILDLPLSLDPSGLVRGRPVVVYDDASPTRFGVFPRHYPAGVRWFQACACCIFHTANTWDETAKGGSVVAVNMLVCRLTSASLIYSAGNIAPLQRPRQTQLPDISTAEKRRRNQPDEEEQCRLYYYRFNMVGTDNRITHQFALSAVPFEFPSLREGASMGPARFVYGCSTSSDSKAFSGALGRPVKIDCLVKMDIARLVARGRGLAEAAGDRQLQPVVGCVDTRTVADVLAGVRELRDGSSGMSQEETEDPIQIFKLPAGWYAQEPRFVARKDADAQREDDGWLLAYVFDEAQLHADGSAPTDTASELWVLDARTMAHVVARVRLPQRVPYGLHGAWFSEAMVRGQRGFAGTRDAGCGLRCGRGILGKAWMRVRGYVEELAG